jgi:hypothetical protein
MVYLTRCNNNNNNILTNNFNAKYRAIVGPKFSGKPGDPDYWGPDY